MIFFGFPEEFSDECLVSGRVPDEVFGTMYFRVAPDDMFYICLFFLIGVREILPVARGSVGIWQLGQYLQRRVIPLLCLLMVQQHGLLLFNYYCCTIV